MFRGGSSLNDATLCGFPEAVLICLIKISLTLTEYPSGYQRLSGPLEAEQGAVRLALGLPCVQPADTSIFARCPIVPTAGLGYKDAIVRACTLATLGEEARGCGWRSSAELGCSRGSDRYTGLRQQSPLLNLCAQLGRGEG
jgi:hypothetical protein